MKKRFQIAKYFQLFLLSFLLLGCGNNGHPLVRGTYTRLTDTDLASETFYGMSSKITVGAITKTEYTDSNTINTIEDLSAKGNYYRISVEYTLPWKTESSLLHLKRLDNQEQDFYHFTAYFPINRYSSSTVLCDAYLDTGTTSSFDSVKERHDLLGLLQFSLYNEKGNTKTVAISSFYGF
ncbi:MAG: hypothetical protein WCR67_07005 [Bacilli bacterium]